MPKGKPNEPLNAQEKAFIIQNVKGTSARKMAAILTEKTGIPRSKAQVSNFYRMNNLKSGLDGRFRKGCISPNKGRRISEWASPEAIERMKAGMFRKGHVGDNAHPYLPVGTRKVRSDGYVWIKTGMPNLWKEEHRLIWEQVNGPLKRYQKLLHIDGNPQNNDLNNLTTISNAECAEINKRIGLTDDRDLNLAIISLARIRCGLRKAQKKQ